PRVESLLHGGSRPASLAPRPREPFAMLRPKPAAIVADRDRRPRAVRQVLRPQPVTGTVVIRRWMPSRNGFEHEVLLARAETGRFRTHACRRAMKVVNDDRGERRRSHLGSSDHCRNDPTVQLGDLPRASLTAPAARKKTCVPCQELPPSTP